MTRLSSGLRICSITCSSIVEWLNEWLLSWIEWRNWSSTVLWRCSDMAHCPYEITRWFIIHSIAYVRIPSHCIGAHILRFAYGSAFSTRHITQFDRTQWLSPCHTNSRNVLTQSNFFGAHPGSASAIEAMNIKSNALLYHKCIIYIWMLRFLQYPCVEQNPLAKKWFCFKLMWKSCRKSMY